MTQQAQHSSGTYFVPDQQNTEELLRVAEQDRFVTASMGGVWAEQNDPDRFQRVLDIGCGAGGWLIAAAHAYPSLTLVGIDINPHMLALAQEQAKIQQVAERITFQRMDALQSLAIPDQSFDLVNLRFASSFVRSWEWPRLLREVWRVLRREGVVRLTDEEIIHQSTSPAAMHFCTMLLCAFYCSGHLFAPTSRGLTDHLPVLLKQQGFQQVQVRESALEYRAGTPEGAKYIQDGIYVLHTLRPFVEKWGCVQEDYNAIRQQVLKELAQADFAATWHVWTAWGSKN